MFFTKKSDAARRSRQRHWLPVFPLVGGFFFPVFLTAQNALPALPDTARLRTVVVQSTRAGSNNPVPHTNLKEADIARIYHAQDIPFLLTGVPSLVETSDGGAGVGYTGLRIRGSDPTRVNVTINGVPLNDAESQGVFWVNLPDIATSAAEIQVQRGVGTSTNGAGAFGATVNIDISKVAPEPSAAASLSAGSFNTRRYTATATTGLLKQKWAFSGRISKIETDGFIDRARADMNSVHLSGAYIGQRHSLQAHILHGHEETYQAWNGVPAQYYTDPARRTFNTAGAEKPGEPYDNEIDNYTQRHHLLHYRFSPGRHLSVQLNGHYTRGYGFFEQYKADQDLAAYGLLQPDDLPFPDLVRRRWLDNHFYGLTFAVPWTAPVSTPGLLSPPEFLLGGAVSRYTGRHFGEIIWSELSYDFPKDFTYYDNDADKRDANIFLKIQTAWRGGFTTFLDVQYRTVDYRFLGFNPLLEPVNQRAILHFFNPKAGLSWNFRPDFTAYAYFGIANREPNRDDYTQSTPGSRPRAERLYDWEGGIKWKNSDFSVTANCYWMQYRDQLVLDGRLNDVGAYIRTNVPESYRAGVELEAHWQVLPRWWLSGNAAFSRNKIKTFTAYLDNWETGQQLSLMHRNTDIAFSPSVIARGATGIQVAKNMGVELSGKYVGAQFLDNTGNPHTQLPGYFFSDLRVNWLWEMPSGTRASVIFSINNLFDAQFAANGWAYRFISPGYNPVPDDPYTRREGGDTYHQAGFFPQAGRNIMATLRVEI